MLRLTLLLGVFMLAGCNASDSSPAQGSAGQPGQGGAAGAAGQGGGGTKPDCEALLPKQNDDCVTNEECGEWMGCYYEKGCEKTHGSCHRLDGCPDGGGPAALYSFCDCEGNRLDGGWNSIGVGGPWGGDCGAD
jgi:hypothetical protein